MKNENKLVNLYADILKSVSVAADDEGLLSMHLNGGSIPVSIDNKRMVLPTSQRLKAGDLDSYVAFHPMGEKLYRGESKVITKLRAMCNVRLTAVTSILIDTLTELAVDKDMHPSLTPQQSEMLQVLDKVDTKSATDFGRIVNSIDPTGENRFVSIYLKRGGTFKGEKYSRVAVTSFPITEDFEIEDGDRYVAGIKLRVRDYRAFKDLFYFIIPEADDLEEYSYGSRSLDAPYLDSLLNAYALVAARLNKVTYLFRKYIPDYSEFKIDLSFLEELPNASKYAPLIPNLAGNDGVPVIDAPGHENVDTVAEVKSKVAKTNRSGSLSKFATAAMGSAEPIDETPPPTNENPFQVQSQQQPQQQPQQQWQAPQEVPVAAKPSTGKISFAAAQAARMANAQMSQQQWQQPQQQPQQQWQQPQPVQAPPGFGGSAYSVQSPQPQQSQWQQQQQQQWGQPPQQQQQQQWGRPQQQQPWGQPQQQQPWGQPQQGGMGYPNTYPG